MKDNNSKKDEVQTKEYNNSLSMLFVVLSLLSTVISFGIVILLSDKFTITKVLFYALPANLFFNIMAVIKNKSNFWAILLLLLSILLLVYFVFLFFLFSRFIFNAF